MVTTAHKACKIKYTQIVSFKACKFMFAIHFVFTGINNVIKSEVMAKYLAGINIKNPCANTFATCYLQVILNIKYQIHVSLILALIIKYQAFDNFI